MHNIATPRGNGDGLAVYAELQGLKNAQHFLGLDIRAEKCVDFIGTQGEHGGLGQVVHDIDNAVNDLTGTEKLDQLTGTVDCGQGIVHIKTLFKFCRSLGPHAEGESAFSDAGAVEVCRLENDIDGIVDYLAVLAAHYACKADCTGVVCDDEHVGIELAQVAVERGECFAVLRTADDYLAALDIAIVKSVHRLAVFHHDIVCDINNVVNGTHAHCTQTLTHPLG